MEYRRLGKAGIRLSEISLGATKPEQVLSNVLAAGERLSADVLREIDGILGRDSSAGI